MNYAGERCIFRSNSVHLSCLPGRNAWLNGPCLDRHASWISWQKSAILLFYIVWFKIVSVKQKLRRLSWVYLIYLPDITMHIQIYIRSSSNHVHVISDFTKCVGSVTEEGILRMWGYCVEKSWLTLSLNY